MALVKKISLHFPAFTTDTFELVGTECIGHSSSDIEIESCYMDTDTYIMWITPLEKNSYINSDTFYVETRGLAIMNPTTSGSLNKNLFVVKYYTW
jgi:hypothetical protein